MTRPCISLCSTIRSCRLASAYQTLSPSHTCLLRGTVHFGWLAEFPHESTMIIDTEPSPKSATVSDLGSPQSSNQPGQSISSHHSQYHVSYSTFSETHSSRANIGAYSGSSVSDITGLLSQDHPHTLSDDDLPPAYNEIHTRSNSRRSNRFWTRCAGIFLTILMILSTWYSYEFVSDSCEIVQPDL